MLAQDIRSGVRVELGPPSWPTILEPHVFGLLQVAVNLLRGVSRANLPEPLSGQVVRAAERIAEAVEQRK